MPSSDNLFCKDGYIINSQARTLNILDSDDYWTQERIDRSGSYQYYVYKFAAKIALQRKFTCGMDLGCGPGTKTKVFFEKVLKEIILVDQPSSRNLIKNILPESHFIGTDLERCEISLDKSFDLIICADVLEHLFNPMPCLQFAREHLAPSGVAIFSSPERDILRGPDCLNSPHPSHVREWNSEEFKCLLQYSGFNVVNQLFFPIEKLSAFNNAARICIGKYIKHTQWNTCQVAICTIG
jgi:SAM-dependent methyltransferase